MSKGRSLLALRPGVVAVLGLAALLLFAPASYGQVSGAITGTVFDTSGAVVPNANITLVNQATGDIRKTVSNSEGYFVFASVVPATYTVRVELAGFKTWEQTETAMRPGDKRSVSNIVLEVGTAAEQVTIEATPGVVPVDSGERSATLTAKDIQNLSLVGRDVTELIRVLPGMAVFNGGGVGNAAGYDGVVTGFTNAVGNGYVPNGLAFRGGTDLTSDSAHIIDAGCNCSSTQTINADMTAEVKVQTSNFGADSAKGPVVINAVGKSGTSGYHGQGYFYGRDSSMNSATWYMNRLKQEKPKDRYLYPGGNIGGPVPHTNKKMLFWTGYEYYFQKLPPQTPLTSYVPTESMRKGDFSSTAPNNAAFCGTGAPWVQCALGSGLSGTLDGTTPIPASGIIPSSAFDAGGLALLKMIPPPNADPKTTPGGVNYVLPYVTNQNGWIFRTRVDYNFTDNTKLYVSYNLQRQTDEVPVHLWWLPPNSIPFPGGMSSKDNSNTITGHFLHVFGPSLTNEAVATFAYLNFPLNANNLSLVSKDALGYPYKGLYRNGDPMVPSISNGYWTPQPMMDQPDLFYPEGTFVWKKFAPTFEDNLTKVYRTHTLKFGFYWERTANNQGAWAYTNGEVNFYPWGSYTNNTTLNMLLGRPSEYIENNFQAITNMSYRTYSAYAMDSWKAAKRLTLELGARFEHITGWNDDDRKAGFAVWLPQRFTAEAALQSLGLVDLPGISWRAKDPGIPNTGVPNRFAFVSPRLGFAYDLFGTGKTVVRGGWGLYRYHDSYNEYGGALQTAEGSRQYHDYGSSFAGLDALGQAAAGHLGGLASGAYAVAPLDDQWPLTYQYNLTISQRMPWSSLLEIGYVGNSTDHALLEGSGNYRLQNVNLIPIGALFKPDPITGAAPDPANANLANYSPYGTQCISGDTPCTTTAPGYAHNSLEVTRHAGYSNYNGLQVSWTRQKGWATFGLNYTWSKALGIRGTAQLGGSTGNPQNPEDNYGILSQDRAHVFNSAYQFDLGNRVHANNPLLKGLANGWTIAGITSWQSGPDLGSLYNPNFSLSIRPYGATSEIGDQNLSRVWLGTPDMRTNPLYTCSPSQGLKEHQFINPNCFAVPAQGTNGPFMPPYYIRGPAFFNSDLSVYKSFKITESKNIQFRFSAFNFLNHPLVSMDPNNTTTMDLHFTETSPGQWVQTNQDFGMAPIKLGRRVVELAIKYSF